ncbi:hypothetical protein IGI04_016205 [Brassica rapa subsp. trilocularis]|uniref:Uncharacterized protein n=1 Tax=Brassica rapa subsp. trilocularis TaxID=1813537 RepID=A0ABQ7MS88_BRACM|nr:hypothetical protein IGI04_016205 [Brassica rapa subsp. trilocularis]
MRRYSPFNSKIPPSNFPPLLHFFSDTSLFIYHGNDKERYQICVSQKMEKEKLEKIARQGPGEQAAGSAKASGGGTSSAESTGPKVSEDKDRNYAVVAGVVAVVGAIGWYMKSGGKKQQPEVQE